MKQNQPSEQQEPVAKKNASSAPAEQKKPAAKPRTAAKSKTDNTSVHHSVSAPDFAKKAVPPTAAQTHKKQPPKKKLSSTHSVQPSANPEDETLDEALEEPLTEVTNTTEEIPVDAPDEQTVPIAKPQTLFQKIKARRERQAELKMTALELIRKKSGFSEDDIAMMFELGYEDELGRVVGYENLKKLKQDHRQRFEQPGRKHYRTAFGYCGEETLNGETRSTIIAKYMYDRKFLILRTLLTALATILLCLLDAPQLIGHTFVQFADRLSPLFPSVSLLLLIATAALSWQQLNAGLRSFLKTTPTPYSFPVVTLFFVILYDLITLVFHIPALRVNVLACGVLLLLSLCDVLRLLCEMRAFRILCADGEKTVLEPAQPRKKKLRQGKKLVKVINDDIGENFYRVQQAQEITGFFRRFNSTASFNRPMQYLIGLTSAIAFLASFITVVVTESVTTAASVFMGIFFAAAPVGTIFSCFYPLCRANKLLTYCNCALVGDETVEEYADSKTVIFDASDLYDTEKRTEISVRESEDLRRDMKLAGILFRKIGGTLAPIGKPKNGQAADPAVAFVRISDYGIEAVVDNQYHIIAGSADYLKKSGIRIPRESSDKSLRRTEQTGVLYVAIDGVLRLCYEIEYLAKPSFDELAAELAEIDTAVAIQSYDPNLNQTFLQINRSEGAVPIRVIKPGRYEPDTLLKESDTGAVALGRKTDIAYPIHAAKQVAAAKTFGLRMQIVLSLIGGTLALIAAVVGGLPLEPLAILAYQGIGVFLSFVSTRCRITRRTLHLRSKNEP